MDKNKKINWLNIILNTEFQNAIQIKTLKEVSMISKLTREKLKPVVFKSILVFCNRIKFESNVLSIATEQIFKVICNQINTDTEGFDYHTYKEKHSNGIQDSFNDYELSLKEIKIFVKRFHLSFVGNVGYYLYPIINGFENLASLHIDGCNISLAAFVNIGKVLPNLNKLELGNVNLVKSPIDTITSSDIVFPLNLSSLMINNSKVATTDLLLDPYEYLFSKNSDNYTYERFILPKYSLNFLKHFQYHLTDSSLNNDASQDLEEFINSSPKLEYLGVSFYNLKMKSSLNSLKFLCLDDRICFNSLESISSLDSINSLSFSMHTFDNTENFRKLCMLCNNLTELSLFHYGIGFDSEDLIDNFLMKALPGLFKLKTIQISGIFNSQFPKILDFTKFTQIEELILSGFGSTLNIKFDNCKSLKRVKFNFSNDATTDEFMQNFNKYDGWTFKYENYTFFGNKI